MYNGGGGGGGEGRSGCSMQVYNMGLQHVYNMFCGLTDNQADLCRIFLQKKLLLVYTANFCFISAHTFVVVFVRLP